MTARLYKAAKQALETFLEEMDALGLPAQASFGLAEGAGSDDLSAIAGYTEHADRARLAGVFFIALEALREGDEVVAVAAPLKLARAVVAAENAS